MMIKTFGHNLEVDIHGMRVADAKRELISLLNRCDAKVHEIEISHGYHGGTALLKMVRTELSHPRIERKLLSLNQGVTTLVLKKPK